MKSELGGSPLLLINLDRRVDRLERATSRLAAAGLRAERVRAMSAHDALDAGIRVLRPAIELAEWQLTDGNIGCSATHLAIYRRIVAEGLPGAVVLEDDLVLGDDFVDRAERAMARRPPGNHLLQFGWLFERSTLRSRTADRVHRLRHGAPRDRLMVAPFGYGTHCYWVGREFAAAALELFDPVYAPIDAMLRAVTHHASWQSVIHLPSLAGQDDSVSDIRPSSSTLAAEAPPVERKQAS